VSRTGNPYDNAIAESFFATFKTECLTAIPATHQTAELTVFDYSAKC
jgi:transposase InsO family protein